MSLEENFERVLARHEELASLLSQGGGDDPQRFARLSKEYADLEPITAAIRELYDTRKEFQDLAELVADDATDADN